MQNKKQIVFFEGYNTVMIYKIAGLFKKKGYKTVLIRLLEANKKNNEFYKPAFDKIIDFNLTYHRVSNKNTLKVLFLSLKKIKSSFRAFIEILKLRPYVFFGRAPFSTPVAVFRILFRKTPFIYFPYDIRSQCIALATFESAKKHLPVFEIKADRFCFEHADGIMHKGASEELDYLNGRMLGDNIKLPKFKITFHPYCSKDFIIPFNKNKLSKKDKEIHFVFLGGTGEKTKEFYIIQLNTFKKIIEQKMHIHLYFASDVSKGDSGKKPFLQEYKNYPNINYFHIHDSLDPKEIVKEISKYDFGVSPYISLKEHGLELNFGTGNKISTYFEAGIPFFFRTDLLFLNKLMQGYGLKLNWPKNMKNLKKIIEKLDYKELEKRIEKARQDFLMEKHFPRLEEFVKKLAEAKKSTT